jgi:hypothetical protein
MEPGGDADGFRLADEGEPRSLEDILREAAEEEAALAAARGCMAPGGGEE